MTSKKSDLYTAGDEWFAEVVLKQRRHTAVAYCIAVLGLFLATACAFAVAALSPMKTVVPYVIEVDHITGEARVLKQYAGDVEKLTIEEVLSKYWINQYLTAREAYSPKSDLEINFTKVKFLSEGKAFDNYARRFTDESPDNPFKRYGDSRVSVEVKSISFLSKETASVRYELIQSGTEKETRTYWVDVINYHYTNTPADEAQRLTNPLGFKVAEYRSDREVIK